MGDQADAIGRRALLGGAAALGASLALGREAVAAPPEHDYRFVAGRLRSPTQLGVVRPGQEFSAHRVEFISPDYVTNRFRMAYAGHYWDAELGRELAMPAPYRIEGISLQALIDGRWVVAHGAFGGQGGTEVMPGVGVLSDDVVFAHAIPPNTPMASLVTIRAEVGQGVPVNSRARVGTGEGAVGIAAHKSPLEQLAAGKLQGAEGRFGGRLVTPAFIVGVATDGLDRPVFWVDGDSIGYGKNGNENELTGPEYYDGTGALGFLAVALEERRLSRRMAFGNSCLPGVELAERQRRTLWSRQLDLLRLVPNRPYTHIISQHGNNGPPGDYGTGLRPAVREYYRLLQAESAAWGDAPAPIYQTRPLPRPGVWPTSLAAQSPSDAPLASAVRWAFDADLVRGGFAELAGVIPTNTYYGYDQHEHRDKIAVPEFSAVVAKSSAAGERAVWLSGRPAVGDYLLFGSAVDNLGAHVVSVTDGEPVAVRLERSFEVGIAAGLPVQAVLAADRAGLHPSTAGHERIAAAVIEWKARTFGR